MKPCPICHKCTDSRTKSLWFHFSQRLSLRQILEAALFLAFWVEATWIVCKWLNF